MNDYRFFVERVPTPTGMMLLVTDEQERLRALDWEDDEVRMHRLLRLHYGAGLTRLEANAGVSNARRAVEAYYDGAVSAIDLLHVKTGVPTFSVKIGQHCAPSRLAKPRLMGASPHCSAAQRRCGRSGWPMGPIQWPSSFPAIG